VIDTTRRLLISVKPRFAEAILDGSKTIELRRTRPRIEMPTEALIYASSPERALVGTCQVTEVIAYTPRGLWQRCGGLTAVTFTEFKAYFDGCAVAYGLRLTEPTRLTNVVPLPALRSTMAGFQPPQSFRYLSQATSDEVLALAG
jgi:predicted transcriptional regulator